MNISDQCRQAILEHGILMNGDEPAGKSLMTLPVMRVAIIQNEFPPELMTEEFKKHVENFKFDTPDSFPPGIEDAVERALGFWYKGDIEFVDIKENPDFRIVAFSGSGTIGGFSSSPLNDNVDHMKSFLKDPAIGIDMTSQRFSQKYSTKVFTLLENVEDTIRHEFGHSFGVLHTNETLYEIENSEPSNCKGKEFDSLSKAFTNSIMAPISSGISEGSQLDGLLQNTIQHGIPKF